MSNVGIPPCQEGKCAFVEHMDPKSRQICISKCVRLSKAFERPLGLAEEDCVYAAYAALEMLVDEQKRGEEES